MVKIYLYVFYIFIPYLAMGYIILPTIIINTYSKTKNSKSSKTNLIFFYILHTYLIIVSSITQIIINLFQRIHYKYKSKEKKIFEFTPSKLNYLTFETT